MRTVQMAKLSIEQQIAKRMELDELQKTFPNTVNGFLLFVQTIINLLIPGNPDINRVQADICKWLFSGPLYRMIQAQRGQSKTILAAIFAVFCLIHAPEKRVLIVSQKGKRAKEIAGWCMKIFSNVEFLNFMRPDKGNGDRESIEAFDIHWALRGADKSPSITSDSIESGIQGARADIILADDIESLHNSRTVQAKELLEDYSKEFESINTHGDIIYLGTPQSIESIYNNLESRGYAIRIWPGRYPQPEEITEYGGLLAPMIQKDIDDNPSLQTGYGIGGQSGAPTCPEMFDDDTLTRKEISQGPAKFKLQYMLNTQLSDQGRFPLKLCDLVVTAYNELEAPEMPIWASGQQNYITGLPKFGTRNYDKFYAPIAREHRWSRYTRKVMYIDPAGGGKDGDEIGYCVLGLLGVYLYVLAWGGIPGGYQEDKLMRLVNIAKETGCKEVFIERNFGAGSHMAMLAPLFELNWKVQLEDRWETGQKELRIIDVVEPILTSHRLVVSPEIIKADKQQVAQYATEKAMRYSGCFQLAHITRDRDCLGHDDRLDALTGAVRELISMIDFDMLTHLKKRDQAEAIKFLKIHSDPKLRRQEVSVHVIRKQGRRNMLNRLRKR